MPTIFRGAKVFDGFRFLSEDRLAINQGKVSDSVAGEEISLKGGYLLPGLLDLQVNGGGGHQVSGQTTLADLQQVCDTHARLGSTGILPTLITDTPQATAAVLAAGTEAVNVVPGFLGLHLEGPHLDPRRKGAHEASLIHAMTEDDLNRLCTAAKCLPSLMVTVAPESASPAQISSMASAGIVVSLGHTDCSHQTAVEAIRAGARCVTHLFNAMSQLGSREPGLVGAAMTEQVHCGLIADGIHVAPASIRIAHGANPNALFLVSDCMAFAGTSLTEMELGGRPILRRNGQLTLQDGTLAGADLSMTQAVKVIVQQVGLPVETAFSMATSRPAACLGRKDIGTLLPGATADFIHLDAGLSLCGVWRAGVQIC